MRGKQEESRTEVLFGSPFSLLTVVVERWRCFPKRQFCSVALSVFPHFALVGSEKYKVAAGVRQRSSGKAEAFREAR